MPFKPGHKKIPGSGRKKGQLNRQTIEQKGRAEAILQLLENEYLEDDIKNISASQRATLFSDMLEYSSPKLSRVDNRIQANINLSDEPITFE